MQVYGIFSRHCFPSKFIPNFAFCYLLFKIEHFYIGHDGSLRFWNLDTKICIQDSITHRRRFDEAIFNVACHACKPFFASAGADGIAKVFI